MTDVFKMKEDIQGDDTKENNLKESSNDLAFTTPSTLKQKSAKRSLGTFSTPTAYYQGLLTDFGSVYKAKSCSLFSKQKKIFYKSSILENVEKCEKIKEVSGDFDKASGFENKKCANVNDSTPGVSSKLFTDTETHNLIKRMDSLSTYSSSTPEKANLLNDQQFTNVLIKDTCFVSDSDNVNSLETPSHHKLEKPCNLQRQRFDDVPNIASVVFDKSNVIECQHNKQKDVQVSENSAQLPLKITASKEQMMAKIHSQENNLASENCGKECFGNPQSLVFPRSINCIDKKKEPADSAKYVDCQKVTVDIREEKTSEANTIGNEFMFDTCQGPGSFITKDEESQNTEDSGLFSQSSSIDLNDKLDTNNSDLNDILPCRRLVQTDDNTEDVNQSATGDLLSELQSSKFNVVSEDLSSLKSEPSNIENDWDESFTCIVDKEIFYDCSSEIVSHDTQSTISPDELNKQEAIDTYSIPVETESCKDSIPSEKESEEKRIFEAEEINVVNNIPKEKVINIDIDIPEGKKINQCPTVSQCTDKIFNTDMISQDIISQERSQSSDVINGGDNELKLFEDIELNLFNENISKKKKDPSRKGRRKSVRLQLREIDLQSSNNVVKNNLPQINKGDDVTNNIIDQTSSETATEELNSTTTNQCFTGSIVAQEQIDYEVFVEKFKSTSSLSQPQDTKQERESPAQELKASVQQKSKKRGIRSRKKKGKKKNKSTISTSSETNGVHTPPAVITDETPKEFNNNLDTTPCEAPKELNDKVDTTPDETPKEFNDNHNTTPDDDKTQAFTEIDSGLMENIAASKNVQPRKKGRPRKSTHMIKNVTSESDNDQQEMCKTLSSKESRTVDFSLTDDIINEFDGLDDLDIFKEITEIKPKEKTKKKRAQKDTTTRRRSARLAGLPTIDNIIQTEQCIDNPHSSSSVHLETSDESKGELETSLYGSVSQRKIRKVKRTSFGKPLMMLNMFGTIPEQMNDEDQEAGIERLDSVTDECTTPDHLTEDCNPNSESPKVLSVPKDLLDICDEQSVNMMDIATVDPLDNNLVTAEPNLSCTDDLMSEGDSITNSEASSVEESKPAVRQSSRVKQVCKVSKPKKKNKTLEKKPMSAAEIEQLYLNRGYCSKVTKPNLLETIFEASQNTEVAINIGKKKLNRKVTFQCPWLPRKQSTKKKGKRRLMGKTRKYKISDQLLVDKLDNVLNDLDAFETLLL